MTLRVAEVASRADKDAFALLASLDMGKLGKDGPNPNTRCQRPSAPVLGLGNYILRLAAYYDPLSGPQIECQARWIVKHTRDHQRVKRRVRLRLIDYPGFDARGLRRNLNPDFHVACTSDAQRIMLSWSTPSSSSPSRCAAPFPCRRHGVPPPCAYPVCHS